MKQQNENPKNIIDISICGFSINKMLINFNNDCHPSPPEEKFVKIVKRFLALAQDRGFLTGKGELQVWKILDENKIYSSEAFESNSKVLKAAFGEEFAGDWEDLYKGLRAQVVCGRCPVCLDTLDDPHQVQRMFFVFANLFKKKAFMILFSF